MCFAKEPQYHPAGSSYIGKYKNMIAKYIYLAYSEKVFYAKKYCSYNIKWYNY